MSVNKILYGLLTPTGELARISKSYNGSSRYACGEYSYYLTDSKDCEEWLVPEISSIFRVFMRQSWYNSDHENPCLGDFEISELTPVKVERKISEIKLNLPIDIQGKTIDSRDIKYKGEKYIAWNVSGKKENYINLIGKLACAGEFVIRKVVDVVDSLEESVPPMKFEENKTYLLCEPKTYYYSQINFEKQ